MTTEIKRLIRVRTEKGAEFKRDGFGKKKQLSDSWRKPRGQHNKQREQKKAKGALPKPGFGSPLAVRGMHPSGFFEVLAFTLKDLEGLDPATHAVRISATVGTRKRITLQEKAISSGLKVLNARVMKKLGVTEEEPETTTEPLKDTAEPAEKPKTRKETKKPAKSAPAAAPKPAKKPAKKPAEENVEEKTGEPAVKEPAKPTKKSAKPKVKEVPEPEEPKPKAETKPKPKSKKATAAEVKKNE
jgi:large subunit ribosomal protein L32e